MKTRTAVKATLLLIPVIWFVYGHRFTGYKPPDFKDAPRDISAAAVNSAEFGKVSVDPDLDIPVPQAEDAGGDKVQADVFSKYLGGMYESPRSVPIAPGNYKSLSPVPDSGIGQILYSFNVEKMLNVFLYSDTKFKTAKGTTVHVSMNKSSNCPGDAEKCENSEKVFLTLTTGRGEIFFIRVMDVVNYGIPLFGCYKTVQIDGEEFTTRVYADVSSPRQSQVLIKSGSNKVVDTTLINLSEIAAAKGADVTLGKAYKLLYGNEVVAKGKSDAKFTDKKQIVLMPVPLDSATNYYVLYSSDITSSGVIYPEMDPNFGFKLADGILDIFKLK